MAARCASFDARTTRTGPATPHPNRIATIPRVPMDCPVEKFAHPASPTMRETTGSIMNGARADNIGALVNPANLSMNDRTTKVYGPIRHLPFPEARPLP
jgi:hypothetical protein